MALTAGTRLGAYEITGSLGAGAPTQINVVLNWFDELKAKVPVR